MEEWQRISLVICTFGFLREFRPSESFIGEYLTGYWHQFTVDQVNQEIYPLGTYAVLAQLIVVFLVTDMLRYKPVIVLSAVAGIILFAILLWTRSLLALQIGQIFYGTFMASEVAYYTYVYAKVDRVHFQMVTGQTRSALLSGKFLGGVVAQLLVSSKCMDYRQLHYISFVSQVISLCVALMLPAARESLYFYTDNDNEVANFELNPNAPQRYRRRDPPPAVEPSVNVIRVAPRDIVERPRVSVSSEREAAEPIRFSCRNALRRLWLHTITAYTNGTALKWSIWWALATCGQLLVISYVQLLFKNIDPNNVSEYNGAVEATATLLGVAGATLTGQMRSEINGKWQNWIQSFSLALMGAFLIIAAYTNIIWIAYLMYVLFGTVFYSVITIATATVAERLSDANFALVFGINSLVALALQTILTLMLVTKTGFALGPRDQFIVYGCYFLSLSVGFCVAAALRFAILPLVHPRCR